MTLRPPSCRAAPPERDSTKKLMPSMSLSLRTMRAPMTAIASAMVAAAMGRITVRANPGEVCASVYVVLSFMCCPRGVSVIW